MNSDDGSVLRTRASLLFRLQQSPDDQVAWEQFVLRYGPLVRQWCKRWGLQDADADDVTQAVLTRLSQRIRSFQYDPAKRFRAWLRTIAQHALSDYHHERKRQPTGAADSAIVGVLDNVAARDDLVQRLHATFDQELLERAIEEVKSRVEEHTWQAYVLTALEGLKGAEAAQQLGMTVGTVFKAKSKVQQMLQEIVRRCEEDV